MAIEKSTYNKLSDHIGYFNHSTCLGIINTENSIYIIDSGKNREDGEALIETLAQLFPGKKIAAVINTHTHSDHSGGNAVIFEKTGAEIWCSKKADSIMQLPEAVGYMYWGGRPLAELEEGVLVKCDYARAKRFIYNETIKVEGITFTFVPLEGHFFGQCGVIADDGEKKVFFLGDSFFGKNMLKKVWLPFLYDTEAFRKSISIIENTVCDHYISGHGGNYTPFDIHEAAELNILTTIEAELKIMKLLKEEPLTHEQLLKKVLDFAGLNTQMNQYVLIGSVVKSYLACLYDRGLIKYKVENNLMTWYCEKEDN